MMITITTICPICGKEQLIEVQFEDWMRYQEEDILVQEAFPYLDADEREALMTGICPVCWDEMF